MNLSFICRPEVMVPPPDGPAEVAVPHLDRVEKRVESEIFRGGQIRYRSEKVAGNFVFEVI